MKPTTGATYSTVMSVPVSPEESSGAPPKRTPSSKVSEPSSAGAAVARMTAGHRRTKSQPLPASVQSGTSRGTAKADAAPAALQKIVGSTSSVPRSRSAPFDIRERLRAARRLGEEYAAKIDESGQKHQTKLKEVTDASRMARESRAAAQQARETARADVAKQRQAKSGTPEAQAQAKRDSDLAHQARMHRLLDRKPVSPANVVATGLITAAQKTTDLKSRLAACPEPLFLNGGMHRHLAQMLTSAERGIPALAYVVAEGKCIPIVMTQDADGLIDCAILGNSSAEEDSKKVFEHVRKLLENTQAHHVKATHRRLDLHEPALDSMTLQDHVANNPRTPLGMLVGHSSFPHKTQHNSEST